MGSQPWLASCGGSTVKLWDLDRAEADQCQVLYSPTGGLPIHCVRWNHTNFVVASSGEDRRVTLWMATGTRLGALPEDGSEDSRLDEVVHSLCFSRGSRYLCTGGTGRVVRVWDMRKRVCVKALKGHSDTITGVMYNALDQQLASVSVAGDLILHNLVSGIRVAELRDPETQVLRAVEYSPHKKHILATAGDDGSLHLWDTIARSVKVSWRRKHSAPCTALSFSPADPKVIASSGLDKRILLYDPGSKLPTQTIQTDAPLGSLAIKGDGVTLAAGAVDGRILLFDLRAGGAKPVQVVVAHGKSESVVSLHWQNASPSTSGSTQAQWSDEQALTGDRSEDTALMPDPRASLLRGSDRMATSSTAVAGSSLAPAARRKGGISWGDGQRPLSSGGEATSAGGTTGNHVWSNGAVSRLETPARVAGSSSAFQDLAVFSPLVDVQPITPSLSRFWDPLHHTSILDHHPQAKPGTEQPVTPAPPPFAFSSPFPDPLSGPPSVAAANGINDQIAGPVAYDIESTPFASTQYPTVDEMKADTKRRLERQLSGLRNDAVPAEPKTPEVGLATPGPVFTPVPSTLTPTPGNFLSPPYDHTVTVTPPALWGGVSLPGQGTTAAAVNTPSGIGKLPPSRLGSSSAQGYASPAPGSADGPSSLRPSAVARPLLSIGGQAGVGSRDAVGDLPSQRGATAANDLATNAILKGTIPSSQNQLAASVDRGPPAVSDGAAVPGSSNVEPPWVTKTSLSEWTIPGNALRRGVGRTESVGGETRGPATMAAEAKGRSATSDGSTGPQHPKGVPPSGSSDTTRGPWLGPSSVPLTSKVPSRTGLSLSKHGASSAASSPAVADVRWLPNPIGGEDAELDGDVGTKAELGGDPVSFSAQMSPRNDKSRQAPPSPGRSALATPSPAVSQQSQPFALQLVQRGLEESLGGLQRSLHEDIQNVHLELLRQFHIQQYQIASMMEEFQAKQDVVLEELKALRRENEKLRQLY